MAALNVSLESTFDFQRQVINELAVNLDALNQSSFSTSISGIHRLSNVGIGTTEPIDKLTVRDGDMCVGVSTAHGVILTSENGTRYRLIIGNDGTISSVAV